MFETEENDVSDKRFVQPHAWQRHHSRYRRVVVHAYFDTPWFRQIAKRPDLAFDPRHASILKDDASSTLVQTSFDGRKVVIKRYNHRSAAYAVKRLLRVSRAYRCWDAACCLNAADIATPTPIGYIEKRLGVLRGDSYYLCRYEEGLPLNEIFTEVQTLDPRLSTIIDAVGEVFHKLHANRISHGDMKYSNLLWRANGGLTLLDIDATKRVTDRAQLVHLLRKDLDRFLKNFQHCQPLHAQVSSRLSDIDELLSR